MSQSGLPHDAVVYPCSDGQPMAETDIHATCMMYVTEAAAQRDTEMRIAREIAAREEAQARIEELEARLRAMEGASPGPGEPPS